jgi:hypothetical protein
MRCFGTTASPPSRTESAKDRRNALVWALPAFSLVLAALPARAEIRLTQQDRHAIERALGRGTLGAALPSPAIENPGDYVPLIAGKNKYRMLAGPHAGVDAVHRTQPSGNSRWRYELSNDETGFLQMEPDGGLIMAGIEDTYTKALTRYSPGEPFMPKGFQPGSEKSLEMGVKVFDLDDPENVQHEGSLTVSLTHAGAYEINVPAGRFDTVLLKASFHGQIGPAHVDDIQYRFFAKGIGLVAMVERRDVSAFLIYRDRLDVAKVLASARP